MKECRVCKGNRLAKVSGHVIDQFSFRSKSAFSAESKNAGTAVKYYGYIPLNLGFDSAGDDLEFTYCLDCGTMQGDFPVKDEAFEYMLKNNF